MKVNLICKQCYSRLNCYISTLDGETLDIIVKPCEKCLDEAQDNGYDEGYQQGKESLESQ